MVRPAKVKGVAFVGKAAAWLFAANLWYAISQWGLFAVIAKTATQEVVGTFARGFAIVTPVMMFAGLQLRMLLVTDQTGLVNERKYLVVRLFSVSIACAGLAVFSINGDFDDASATVIVLVSILKGIEAVSDIIHGSWQRRDSMRLVAMSLSLRACLSLLVFGCVFVFSENLVYGLLALISVSAAVLALFDLPVWFTLLNMGREPYVNEVPARAASEAGGTLAEYRNILLLGLPLGAVVAMNSLSTNIPRYLLDWNWGVRELGAFAAVGYIMKFGSYFEVAIGQAALPRLACYFADRSLHRFVGLVRKLVLASSLVGGFVLVIAMFASEQLLQVLYREEYTAYTEVVPIIVLATVIGSVAGLLKGAVDASRIFFRQLPLFMVTAAVTFVAGLWLVPVYGVLGAAFALVIARSCLALGYWWILVAVLAEAQSSATTRLSPTI